MKTISKIAYSNDRKNKTRSILIMIAIGLMTMLLTTVGTIGRGIILLQKKSAADSYGSNYGIFLAVDDSQLQEVRRHAEFEELGIMREEGILKGNEKGGFVYADAVVRQMLPYHYEYALKEGAYPQEENEIAAEKDFFKAQGYEDVKVGDTVTLPYRAGMKEAYHAQEFTVSGILYERNQNTGDASYVVFGSEKFYDSRFAEGDRQANVYFTLSDSVPVSMNNLEQVMESLADSCGIQKNSVVINDAYLTWILDPSYETIGVCSILILGILLFSVIVIYHIFQVGIAQKIQEYGKIRALGATRKQMRQLIFKEGMFLALPSVPAGVALGVVAAEAGFHWLMRQAAMAAVGDSDGGIVLCSIPITLFSALVSVLAVMMALRKPMKIVAKISPVEAARYQDNTAKKDQGMRKGRKKVSIFSLAMANIGGNKRRTSGTIFTMGLSCVLFVTISSYTANIDTEYEVRRSINHGQFELQLDYSGEYDEAYSENNLDSILKNNPLNDELIEKLWNIPGVTDVQTREVAIADVNGAEKLVSILDKEDFEMNRWDGDIGNMDYDEAVKNGDIFFGWEQGLEADGYALNMPVSFTLNNGTGNYNYSGKIAGAFAIADTYFVLPKEVYEKLQPEGTSYGYIWVDCNKEDAASVETEIRNLIGAAAHLELKTYQSELQTAQLESRMMRMGCTLFMAILGLIGFMNLANTMIINITTKKQEYGVLQAVGMTDRQLNRSLQLQGLIFTAGTLVVALVLGLPLGYLLFAYAKKMAIFGVNLYHIPFAPVVVMVLLVGGLQMGLSFLLSRNLKKETLVERIRYQG